ncbi:hypothetical protein DDE18_08805 [Nocardioides gansuensis]|uniref:Blue (type 1) copper domain-containing protein n=1 Tax=Nocardioides gansuensis TaxID=2138300 RepID=A0A2T8FCE4_9ACTN|nr:hypothetical protein [Nocardioides gansuensis]PVG83381.1 hypothetical protein DDE18_08805 [Nocardioides gansuensis]
MPINVHLRTAVVGACAAALVGAPTLVSTATAQQAAQQAAQSASSQSARQSVTIVTKGDRITAIRGTNGLRAGRISLTVAGRSAGTVEVVRFAKRYSYKKFLADFGRAFGPQGNMRALKRAIRKTNFIGGFPSGTTGTVVLPRAGKYTTFVFTDRPGRPETFRAGRVKRSPRPDVDARIVGKPGARWGGSRHLPAKGTFELKNTAKDVPHFLVMQQVVEGTTKAQVMEALMSGDQGPPPWALPAHLETSSLSPGNSMTVNYRLPRGQYVLLCFFPDPKMDGMPHALMGMIRMVHVR